MRCRIYDIQVILKIYIKKKTYDIQVISVLINLFVVRFSPFMLNFDEDIVSIMSQQFFHFVLKQHDQIVSGIDWSPRSNRIVTASHDRNS